MKKLLPILLLAGLMLIIGSRPKYYSGGISYLSLGEYYNLFLDGSTGNAYHLLNTYPTVCTNQPVGGFSWVEGGPHDAMAGTSTGGLYGLGSVLGTAGGAFSHVTVDSAGNSLPFVVGGLCTASSASPFWLNVIWTTDSTTGRQVGMYGMISGGIHGNGTNTSVNQTTVVWANIPNGVHIVKVVGQYCLLALTSNGQVYSWGGGNNKAMLMRGTSPAVSYMTPDTINLGGAHAVDIGGNGDVAVIVLNNGHVLGGGDQPKYWGGASASSSNTPQDFTSFLTSSVGTNPGTGISPVPAKVAVNSGAVYYWFADSSLAASGDNICGQIGNGKMFPMNNYAVSPAPNGSTPQPYAYDNAFLEFPQYTPVRIMPGSHNWLGPGYCGPSNCWNNSVVNSSGENWTWGRGKAMQTGNGRASCQYFDGNLNGTTPDMVNNPYPMKINLLAVNSGNLITPTCFYCIANPAYTSCSHGVSCYNGSLAAPVVNGGSQTIAAGATTANITPSITYASGSKELWNYVTYFSGPAPPIMPYNTGSSIPVYGLVPGTYTFKDSSTDIMWKTNVGFYTVVVPAFNKINFPLRVNAYNEKNSLLIDRDRFVTFSE